MTTDLAARVLACLALLASGCSLALEFSPDVLLPTLDVDPATSLLATDAGTDAEGCDASACLAPTCRAPEVSCGAQCVDLQDDHRHCGACGVRCGTGAMRCCRGVCAARCE